MYLSLFLHNDFFSKQLFFFYIWYDEWLTFDKNYSVGKINATRFQLHRHNTHLIQETLQEKEKVLSAYVCMQIKSKHL